MTQEQLEAIRLDYEIKAHVSGDIDLGDQNVNGGIDITVTDKLPDGLVLAYDSEGTPEKLEVKLNNGNDYDINWIKDENNNNISSINTAYENNVLTVTMNHY